MSILKILGIIIAVVVLAPIVLLVAAIGLAVAIVVALAAAFIWVLAKIFEFGAYIIGGGLWEDIQGLVSATTSWISSKFNEAVDFVKGIFGAIADWFKVNVWDRIVAIFTVVGTWFKDRFQEAWNNVKAIWTVLGDFFKERWENLKTNLAAVGTWFKEKFQEAWNGVKAIWEGLGNFFKERWDNVKTNLGSVATWFRDKFQEGWNAIKGVFGAVGEWFRVNVIDVIVNKFSGIKDRITGFFSGIWDGLGRGLKDALNSILRLPLTIPSVTVAGKTIGGQTLIPRLARGGIVEQATLAMVGESGKEAIVPLENNMEWVDKLAAKINAGGGTGGSQPIQLVVQIGEDKVASKIIDLINEKTHMSGRNTIYV